MLKYLLSALFMLSVSVPVCQARHSSYSPMAPRQISSEAAKADYSYGLTVLPGRTIDSIEGFNRMAFKTNYYVIDRYLLRPVAHGYALLPTFSRTGIHNFISNVGELPSTVNNAVLGNFQDSFTSLGRFAINTTIGLLGFIDVATPIGLENREMEMDTVMGRYGMDSGTYVMIPALGPYTERSFHGSMIDGWPMYLVPMPVSLAFKAISAIDARAALIPQEELIDNAIDPYAQLRTVYLQYHEGKVHPDAAMENKTDENVEEFIDEID